jgi:MSHA biogenesis protein MshM
MYQQHFGLTHPPLGKDTPALWDDGALEHLQQRFTWLLESPGIGLLTGEPGVGKTAALRHLTDALNPHRYRVIYQPETDFGRLDLYRGLALALDLEPPHRRAPLWRALKARISELTEGQHLLPVWLIDEAQNLPPDFFRDLPAFLNFAFDSRDLMTVWLVGRPVLAHTLQRALYAPLATRIQVRVHLEPISERARFEALITHALQQAGCQQRLLSDSGMELLRQASQGLPRKAARLLKTAMQLAVPKGLNHLPDEIIECAIKELP